MTDPTLAFLAGLDDPTRYVVRRAVPVFKPHTRHVPERYYRGMLHPARTIVVTEADLPGIAANAARAEAAGVPVRVTPGHVDVWERDERALPGPWGFYRGIRVGVFGPAAEACILGDEFIKTEFAAERAGYPYRSAEFDPVDRVIRGVALLKRDPALDLGIVCYAAGPDPLRPNPALPAARPADAARRHRAAARRAFVADAVAYGLRYGVGPEDCEEAFAAHLRAARAVELHARGGMAWPAAEATAAREAAAGPLSPDGYAGADAARYH